MVVANTRHSNRDLHSDEDEKGVTGLYIAAAALGSAAALAYLTTKSLLLSQTAGPLSDSPPQKRGSGLLLDSSPLWKNSQVAGRGRLRLEV